MTDLQQLTEKTERDLLFVFLDLTSYGVWSWGNSDVRVAELLDEYYKRVGAKVADSGGTVVKCMGDGMLLVYPREAVDSGVIAMLDLKVELEDWLRPEGMECVFKAHFGRAIAGPFGPDGLERFDVIGGAVSTAALVKTRSFALTAEAFRTLAPATRERFKKHTPPITYIRTEDRHDRP